MLDDFLPLVEKPARYINNEINAVHKDLSRVSTSVCLFFPDTYEVGMSHLGLRILYRILNDRPDTACERVFSPWTDYEARLRAAGRPLTSLESNRPLSQFDIIGVTLQYELSYTNILAGLEMGGIPVLAADRKGADPIVIAGGPCAVNPEPLSEFIDVFFIGEAEEAIHEIIDQRQAHRDRREFLEALAKREGFLVPGVSTTPVRRRYVRNLDAAPYPHEPLVPLMKPIHDRISAEVARGCIRGCRFCQAGIIYRPYRERSPENVKAILEDSLRCTGYEELSLASLSSGDYSEIQPLILELMKKYRDSRVSISLPSLRVGTLTPEMIEAIAATRKTGFTLAPEAGTERLRRVINKPVSNLDLMDAAETIFRNGWSTLKLYFMIGLPTETDEDLDGITALANDLLSLGKRVSRRHVQLNISVSTFVPKPHTPFQWIGQATLDEIKRKQAYLRKALSRRGITLKPHNPEMSMLEAVFARGDRSVGAVIRQAVALGCRFDGWTETFDFSRWVGAFQACGLDPQAFAARSYGLDDRLPWDLVRPGVTAEFLKREYGRSLAAETTENCRVECVACGMGCVDGGSTALGKPQPQQSAPPAAPSSARERSTPPELTTRIRIKYAKTGRLRFLSHLDFMTLVHRVLQRASVPVGFSQGFNPHPKIAFGPALSVGMESTAEFLDMETDPFVDLLQLVKDLNRTLPEAVRILEARVIPRKAPSLSGSISRYEYTVAVPAAYAGAMRGAGEAFLARTSVMVERNGKQKDIRPGIESIGVTDAEAGIMQVVINDSTDLRPRIQDVVMQAFGIDADAAALFRITRIAQYWNDSGTWRSPMEIA